MDKKKILQILIPVLIIVVIAGLYIQKNFLGKSNEIELSGTSMPLSGEYDLDGWLAEGKPVLIEFGTESCPFCAEMAVRLQAMHEKYGDQIIIKNVDLNQVPDAGYDFPLSFVPAQFMFDAEGKPFVPTEETAVKLQRHYLKGTTEHALTGHVGAIPDEPFEQLILEMIND